MKKVLLCIGMFLVAPTATLFAQNDSSTYHESVIVVGDYNPVLDGVTEKVNVAPAVNDNVAADLQPQFRYSITPRRITSVTAASGLKAAKVVASPTRLYNNYLRLGLGHDFGNFADFNPLMDLYYMSTRHDDYAYGVRLYHQTDVTTFGKEDKTTPSPDYYGRTRQSDTKLDLFGKYILNKKHLFSAGLGFDRQYGRYYGFSDSTLAAHGLSRDDIDYSDIAFTYNNVALKLGASSLNTDVNRFGYDADFGLADLWGKLDFNQFSTELDGSIHYGFPMFRKYKAIAYLHGNWQHFTQHTDVLPATGTTDNVSSYLLTVNPYVDMLFSNFKVHAGLAFGIDYLETLQNPSHTLFPDITLTKSFMNNTMSLVVGFQGGYLANDWNSIRLLNPYVTPGSDSRATSDNDLFAHLRVDFSKKLKLNVNADNHIYENRLFFRPNYILGNTFLPYYIDLNVLDLGGEFTFVNDEMITLALGGEYHLYYNAPDNVPLLYAPDITAHLGADINYKDKWLFELQALFVSKVDASVGMVPGFATPQVTGTLPANFGLSIGAEYIHSRALSFFAKIDNVTAQRNFIWANYPTQRINLMLGLTYTIPTK